MNTIQQKISQKGFTIVELLIVIVVIGILAAITIVAFNGIQNRGKAASGQSLAGQVAKKAEAYNTVQSSYPTTVAAFDAIPESKLDNPSAVKGTTITAADADSGKAVGYVATATGGCVSWWDYSAATAVAKTIRVGGGGAGC